MVVLPYYGWFAWRFVGFFIAIATFVILATCSSKGMIEPVSKEAQTATIDPQNTLSTPSLEQALKQPVSPAVQGVGGQHAILDGQIVLQMPVPTEDPTPSTTVVAGYQAEIEADLEEGIQSPALDPSIQTPVLAALPPQHHVDPILKRLQASHRKQSLSVNPYRRPRSLPKEFSKRPWNNRLPVFKKRSVGTFSSDFGWRRLYGRKDFHGGVDIMASPGTSVRATVGGTIVHLSRAGYYGGLVVALPDRMYTYWHMYPMRSFKVGDTIKKGQKIGELARRGKATHLHYAVHLVPNGDWKARSDKNAIDPLRMYRKLKKL